MARKSPLTSHSPLLTKYQSALFQASIGLWEWTRKDDTLYCDRGICRLYGIDAEEINGPSRNWYEALLPEDREITRKMIEQAWNDEIEIDSKFRVKLQSGEIKHIRTSAIKIYDENHQVSHLVGLNWDITKESTLKKDLAETKSFLEDIIDSVPDPIFVKNRKQDWVFVNKGFAEIIGKPKEELFGKNDSDFFEETLKNTYWEHDEKVFKTGEASENEEKIRDSKGEYRDVLTKKSLLAGTEPGPMLVGIMRDITENKKIHKSMIEQSKLASLGEVSAGMAHEINNPLSIISGKMMILKTQLERDVPADPNKLRQTCDAVLKNCQRIEKIVRTLNSFSRNTKSGPMEKIFIGDIFEELKEFVAEKLEKAEIKIDFEIENESLFVNGRTSELIQVLINLINNSFDAIRNSKSPWINVSSMSSKNKVIVEISDSGEGIPPEIASQMMEFFFTTKPSGQGTGLGLSLAHQIIKSHGGTIEYLADRKNTTFRLELPIIKF